MASILILLFVFNLSTLVLSGNNCPETIGFCSQVYEMQRVCSGLSPDSQIVTSKVGKAGPPGRKGEPGEPASVDYGEINKKITTKFRELESRIDGKFKKYDQLVEKLDNRTKKIELQLESRIDAKFARAKQLIEKKTNRTERIEKLLHNECTAVTKEDAISWDGKGGLFNLYRNGRKYEVYCDLTTDGGGWLVFQRRIDGSLDFQRNWDEYVSGFGNKKKEFWMGLETIHQLVHGGDYELRIDLTDWAGESAYAKYRSFSVGDASTKYRLNFGSYLGNAGNALNHHKNRNFSTKDQDNDAYSSGNCAAQHGGGWWFGECDHANLNGIYHGGSYSGAENGVEWHQWNHGGQYSMKTTEMKFRLMT